MDEQSIRAQLDHARRELIRNRQEHDVLVRLVRDFEDWLRVHGYPVERTPMGLDQLRLPLQSGLPNGAFRDQAMLEHRNVVQRALRNLLTGGMRTVTITDVLRKLDTMGVQLETEGAGNVVSMVLRRTPGFVQIGPDEFHYEGPVPEILPGRSDQEVAPPASTEEDERAKMPKRREAFQGLTLIQAIRSILHADRAIHANDIASQIYDVQSPDELRAAKGALVSTFVRGVKRDIWKRGERPNTYRLISNQRTNVDTGEENAGEQMSRPGSAFD